MQGEAPPPHNAFEGAPSAAQDGFSDPSPSREPPGPSRDAFGEALAEELEISPAPVSQAPRPRARAAPGELPAPPADWSLAWWLPGHGEPGRDLDGKVTCGEWRFFAHQGCTGSSTGWSWRRAPRTCGRFSCPVCALKEGGWAYREAGAISERVLAGCQRAGRPPIHVVVSPPQSRTGELGAGLSTDSLRGYRRLRAQVYRAALASGFHGGACIFHDRRLGARRWNGRALGCRRGPHFHLVGEGWIRTPHSRTVPAGNSLTDCEETVYDRCELCAILKARRLMRECPECPGGLGDPRTHTHPWRTVPGAGAQRVVPARHDPFCGWVVSNLSYGAKDGRRRHGMRSVFRTSLYVLSHAAQGILPKPEPARVEPPAVVTWFGSMAYSKLKIARSTEPGYLCKVCEKLIPAASWVPVVWEGSGPPPDDDAGPCLPGQFRAETLELSDFRGKSEGRWRRRSWWVGPDPYAQAGADGEGVTGADRWADPDA